MKKNQEINPVTKIKTEIWSAIDDIEDEEILRRLFILIVSISFGIKKREDDFLLLRKDSILADLKEQYEASLDLCGEDDEINTIPAKELYEKACIDILSCKDDIEAFYKEKEYWDEEIKRSNIRSEFKIVK